MLCRFLNDIRTSWRLSPGPAQFAVMKDEYETPSTAQVVAVVVHGGGGSAQ